MTNTSRSEASLLAALRAPRSGDPPARDPDDFSVVLGGPLYQLIRRAHLAGDALQLWRRRIVVIALVAWLPLLILSMLEKRAWGDATVSVLFVICLASGIGFVWRSLRRRERLVDLALLAEPRFAVACLFSFVLGMGLYTFNGGLTLADSPFAARNLTQTLGFSAGPDLPPSRSPANESRRNSPRCFFGP